MEAFCGFAARAGKKGATNAGSIGNTTRGKRTDKRSRRSERFMEKVYLIRHPGCHHASTIYHILTAMLFSSAPTASA